MSNLRLPENEAVGNGVAIGVLYILGGLVGGFALAVAIAFAAGALYTRPHTEQKVALILSYVVWLLVVGLGLWRGVRRIRRSRRVVKTSVQLDDTRGVLSEVARRRKALGAILGAGLCWIGIGVAGLILKVDDTSNAQHLNASQDVVAITACAVGLAIAAWGIRRGVRLARSLPRAQRPQIIRRVRSLPGTLRVETPRIEISAKQWLKFLVGPLVSNAIFLMILVVPRLVLTGPASIGGAALVVLGLFALDVAWIGLEVSSLQQVAVGESWFARRRFGGTRWLLISRDDVLAVERVRKQDDLRFRLTSGRTVRVGGSLLLEPGMEAALSALFPSLSRTPTAVKGRTGADFGWTRDVTYFNEAQPARSDGSLSAPATND